MLQSGFAPKFRKRASHAIPLMGALGLGVVLIPMAGAQTSTQMTSLSMTVPSVIAKSTLKSHTASTTPVHLTISLQFPNAPAVKTFADSVSNPKSPTYRQFLTPEQFGAKFGRTAAEFKSVQDYLTSQGFKIVLAAKNNLNILVDGNVGQVEKAFGTTVNNYQTKSGKEPGNQVFFSYAEPLKLPKTIAPLVLAVSGAETFTKAQPKALTMSQTRTLYNTAPMYDSGNRGEGRNVAISSFDGFRLSNLAPFYAKMGLPTPSGGVGSNVIVKAVGGGSGSGTPSGEGDLDIQMVLGMAPLCTFTIYDGGSGLASVLTQEANDNTCDIISESYGWNLSDADANACHNLHLQMTAQGITYMEATGDFGTTLAPFEYSNYEPEVLQVGGTIATVDSFGHRNAEVGWSGSGGGWSTRNVAFNTRPTWQVGSGVPTTINFRLNPDISLHAAGNGTGAYQFFLNGALSEAFDGTSFASPVFAGMLAVTEQKLIARGGLPADANGKRRFGRMQDLLYTQAMRKDVYFDVVTGANGNLPNGTASVAGAGWDFVTGLGVMDLNAFNTSIIVIPPIQVNPLNAAIFQSLGTAATGDASKLAKVDALYYTENSVPQTDVGAVSAAQIKFTLSGDTTKITSLDGQIVANALNTCTNYIYALNVKTGQYDLLKTTPLTTANTSITFSIPNWANYVSATNQVTIVTRALNPTRLGGAKFTLKIDQAQLVESF